MRKNKQKIKFRCAVPGCEVTYLSGNPKNEPLFLWPKPARIAAIHLRRLAESRLTAWRKAVSVEVISSSRICGRHFVKGKPARLTNTADVDWVPSIFDGVPALPLEQHESEELPVGTTHANVEEQHHGYSSTDSATENGEDYEHDSSETQSASNNSYVFDTSATDTATENEYNPRCCGTKKSVRTQKQSARIQVKPVVRDHFTQTEDEALADSTRLLEAKISKLTDTVEILKLEIEEQEKTIRRTKVDLTTLQERPGDVKYYTGLDDYRVVNAVFNAIKPHLMSPLNLTKEQVFLMTLQKLRFNYFYKSLSISYNISPATTAKYFVSCVCTLYTVFLNLVYWPERDILKKHTPKCFLDAFGNATTVIIDCFEIKGQRSSDPVAAAQQWSEYKKSPTAKYLIGISPAGSVIFVSKGYGGRASDKTITKTCGFLDNLLEGDVVMADRGFLIKDYVEEKHAELNLPAFRKQGGQLAAMDVENTRKIATVRIHVERVIGVMREKYQLLKNHVPMTIITRRHNGVMVMDMIVFVAAILVNLCRPIVN